MSSPATGSRPLSIAERTAQLGNIPLSLPGQQLPRGRRPVPAAPTHNAAAGVLTPEGSTPPSVIPASSVPPTAVSHSVPSKPLGGSLRSRPHAMKPTQGEKRASILDGLPMRTTLKDANINASKSKPPAARHHKSVSAMPSVSTPVPTPPGSPNRSSLANPAAKTTPERPLNDDESSSDSASSNSSLTDKSPTPLSTPPSSPDRSSSADSTTGTNPADQAPPSPPPSSPNSGPKGPKGDHGCFYNFCMSIFKCLMMIFTFGQYGKNG